MRRTNATITSIQARTTFFFLFFSLLSSFSSAISIKTTNDNTVLSDFDWSRLFDTHIFFFIFYDSPCLSCSLAFSRAFDHLLRPLLFRAHKHRAYQWNFRTAADASGDDINTYIVLFITSGFLFDRNLRWMCTRTHLHTMEQIQFFV